MRKLMSSVSLLVALVGCSGSGDGDDQNAGVQMSLDVTPVTQITGERARTDLIDSSGRIVAVVELDFQAKMAAILGPGSSGISFDLARLSADQLPATVEAADQLAVSAYQASQRSVTASTEPMLAASENLEPIGKNTSAIKFGWRCEWCGDQDLAYRCMTCGFCGNYECWFIELGG